MGKHEVTLKLEDTKIDKVLVIISSVLVLLVIISLLVLTHPITSATVEPTDTKSATASVNVNAACTLSSTITPGEEHNATLSGGQYNGNVGTTTVKSICNDSGGYALYAIGYSNNTYGTTNLINNSDSSITIPTGIATSGNNSAWSMKLTATGTTNVPTIVSGNNYTIIPSTYTKVAYYPNSTMNPSDPSTHDDGSYLTTTYGIYVSPTQAPGTYTGAVKYTLVHPNNAIPQNKYYMQDFTTAMCEVLANSSDFTVYDKRDEKSYTVRYINDRCWMTQNLAIEPGTHMTTYDTNITPDQYNNDGYFALPGEGYDLRVDRAPAGGTSTGNCRGTMGANSACTHVANETDVAEVDYFYTREQLGAWYNYAAISATSIVGIDNTEVDVYNICPSDWTIPTDVQLSTLLNAPYAIFQPIYGGYYGMPDDSGKTHIGITTGFWGSASVHDGTSGRYSLKYLNGTLLIVGDNMVDGRYVRCLTKTP